MILFSGCEATGPAALGEVYAGPASTPLREEIGQNSKVTATVKHGDRLAVLQQRRRLYRVRTRDHLEGWTDERNLLSTEQMQALIRFEEMARSLPNQGIATSFEVLNIHAEPQRYSPSFVQIRENEKFEVIGHRVAPRAEVARRILIKPVPKIARPGRRKSKAEGRGSLQFPPPPEPPKPPEDWERLSRERDTPAPSPDGQDSSAQAAEPSLPPVTEDWTLVRTQKGACGWVLTGRIFMAIPDDVAQYAEGRRISSYFLLGTVHDTERNEDKGTWLWTTIHSGQMPFDFDQFRVFTWNLRKHRYETAYIQRSIEGFLPVSVHTTGTTRDFLICLANDDGSRSGRGFTMIENHVKATGPVPCLPQPSLALSSGAPSPGIPALPNGKPVPFSEKLQNWKKRLLAP